MTKTPQQIENEVEKEHKPLTEWDMVTGDWFRDYDNISPELWLELYANDEPDLSGLENEVSND